MKIYTKTGDGGTTSLIGGRRVAKTHPRVEAYGTVDELMAHIGHLRDCLDPEKHAAERDDLLTALNNGMTVSSILACEGETLKKLPEIGSRDIAWLESRIDEITEHLSKTDKFTLPGGHPLVSLSHIARTVCRRAERRAAAVESDDQQHLAALQYLNRLSDYLYVLGRKLAADLHAEELLWIPGTTA
jgi:cob(I)alamin adenosyltransferase